MTDPFIRIHNLVKHYPTPGEPLEVLRGINLNVRRGDFIALVGPSGSGKTTFLNMLTAIDMPTAGTIVVDGVDITDLSQRKLGRWRGRNVGVVFQFFQLLPSLTVLQNVAAPMDLVNVWYPGERKERALDLLTRFGIVDQADKTPDMLSGGQQQRVAIARALANNPPLIVADEPTGNLDRMNAEAVFDLFAELTQAGTTIITVTHDRKLAQRAGMVFELANGQIRSAFTDPRYAAEVVEPLAVPA